MTAWASLPIAILPCGISTAQVMPGPRGVRRRRRRGVAGRRAQHGLLATGHRFGDRHRHAAVLERAGRVEALDLQMHCAAGVFGQPLGVDQRRTALQQGDRRPVVLDRQSVAVGGYQAGPRLVHRLRAGVAHSLVPSSRSTLATSLHDVEIGERGDGVRQCRVGRLMGDHHDPGTAPLAAFVDHAFLTHLGDAHFAFAEFGCDGGQYAWPVGDVHADVVASGDEPDRRDGQLGVFRLARVHARPAPGCARPSRDLPSPPTPSVLRRRPGRRTSAGRPPRPRPRRR